MPQAPPRMLLLCAAALWIPQPAAALDLPTLQGWGREVAAEIESSLGVPGTSLYAETAWLSGAQSGGINGRAFVWPASTQFRVLNSLVQIEPQAYAPTLRQFSDELHAAYWDDGYRSGAGAGDRFYDDNGHLVVALVEAFNLTGDPVYLDRATQTYDFVLEGEDAAAGGGVYFKQFLFDSKDAISTLQGARGAAMLHRATGDQQYLDDATRLLGWVNSRIQKPDGLFAQGYLIASDQPNGIEIVNSAGIGISANLELYHATGDAAYLAEAQRIGFRTNTRYFDSATGRINDEGYWAYELVDAYNDLYLADSNPLWRSRVQTAMQWLRDNKEDPNGHYGVFWGRNGPISGALGSWSLNEQASVARAYLDSSITVLPGDVNLDGAVDQDDITAFVDGWRSDTSALDNLGRLGLGDLDLDGFTGATDFTLFRSAVNDAGVVLSAQTLRSLLYPVPSPSSGAIAAAAAAAQLARRRRRA